jgi:uncharacterized FlgJ-related protein
LLPVAVMRFARPLSLALLLALVAALGGGARWWWQQRQPAPVLQETTGTRIAVMLDVHKLSDDQRDAITALLPVVLQENIRVMAARVRVQDISARYLRDASIGEDDFNWLKALADSYQLAPQSRSDSHFFGELLARVDVVPPSLVLAHMAQGLGTVDQAGITDTVNALTFRRQSCHGDLCIGLGLRSGHSSLSAAVAAVGVSDDSVRRYMMLLNTDPAYAEFRLQRLGMRNRGETIKGLPLLATLHDAGVRDGGYVDHLRSVIVNNDLQGMD